MNVLKQGQMIRFMFLKERSGYYCLKGSEKRSGLSSSERR